MVVAKLTRPVRVSSCRGVHDSVSFLTSSIKYIAKNKRSCKMIWFAHIVPHNIVVASQHDGESDH